MTPPIKNNINDFIQSFNNYKNQQIEPDSPRINSAIDALQEIGNRLEISLYQDVTTLHDAGRTIRELDSYCSKDLDIPNVQHQAFSCHTKAAALLKSLDNVLDEYRTFKEIIENLKSCKQTFDELDYDILEKFADYASVHNEWEILTRINLLRSHIKVTILDNPESDPFSLFFPEVNEVKATAYSINKLAYHLMMDKLLIPQKNYNALSPEIPAEIMIRTLTSIGNQELHLPQDGNLETTLDTLKTGFREILSEYILLNHMQAKAGAKKIVDRLQIMEPGQKLLIPTGFDGHATALLVEKNVSGSYKMTLYNTGSGVMNWHPRWQMTNRYQTFYSIDYVPEDSILTIHAWRELYICKSIAGSMNPTYELIRDVLGKGGKILSPSEHIEDYEAKQSSGTCSMQCLMASLRHECMQIAEGSPAEREAAYKFIKAKMLGTFHRENLDRPDDVIRGHLPTVLKKLEAENTLIEIAREEGSYRQAMDRIEPVLNQAGKQEIVKQLIERGSKTCMARYATLRMASVILCNIWLADPKLPLPADNNDAFALGLAKLEQQKAISGNLQTILQNASQETQDALCNVLYRIFVATPYEETGIRETIKYLGDELPEPGKGPEGMQKLLKSLYTFRVHMTPTIQKLAVELEKNDKSELSNRVKTFWKELA